MDSKQSNSSMDAVPFDQASCVVPEKLMAGCYPGSEDPVEAE